MRRRRAISAALSACLLLTVGLLEAAPATVEVKFSAPVQVKQLAGRVLVNSNRRYVLGSVPKSLQGLKYTQHEHDNPATLSVTVVSGGDLHLCLCNNTPESLTLKGAWKQVAETNVQVEKPYKFVFYKCAVKKGDKLEIPADRQWGSILIAGQFSQPGKLAGLRAAVKDLTATFGDRYPKGKEHLSRLDQVDGREVLLANPLLTDHSILFVARHPDRDGTHKYLGGRTFRGNGSALKLLDVKTGQTKTLVENRDGVIRSPCVHFDGKRVLFSMNKKGSNFHIYEISVASGKITQLTSAADVSDVDPVYLPDGNIVFASSRNRKWVPCSVQLVPQLFRMTGSGANIHQITRSLVHENQVSVMPDGRILYSRWDYVDRNFADGHGFWVANPDGTNQAIIWGNNTAHPSAGWNARVIPETNRLVCILGTHHGSLGGAMAVLDPGRAIDGYDSIAQTWPAHVKQRFDKLEKLDISAEAKRHSSVWKAYKTWPEPARRLVADDPNLRIHRWEDTQRDVVPWYDTPWPLSDVKGLGAGKYFLASRASRRGGKSAIWLVDVFGNEVMVHGEAPGCYAPMPLAPSPKPTVMASRRDYGEGDGYFYVRNVYIGTHMKGIRRGVVKYLRVVETPDKEGLSRGWWNCLGSQNPAVNYSDFNTKRILGTVPVAADGSANFAVPSDRFVYFQLLDKDRMMIQSMRSGTSVHSGETLGCVGCHESRLSVEASGGAKTLTISMRRRPSKLEPWYGPARRYSYVKEVQPVLDKHCLKCHDFGKKGAKKVILSGDRTMAFNFSYMELWRKGYVGAIGAGPAGHLPPYSWGSHASKLIAHLRKGHQKVKLSDEDMDRLITWADLNGPYYPTTISTDGGGGRSALDYGSILKHAGLQYVNVFRTEFFDGPMVNLDRPELSPCLSRVKKSDPRYNKLLEAIRNGANSLKTRPRGDVMDGLVPHSGDQYTIKHRKKYDEYERRVRKAIREGKELRDSDFAGGSK